MVLNSTTAARSRLKVFETQKRRHMKDRVSALLLFIVRLSNSSF